MLVNNAGIGFGAAGEGRQVSADGRDPRFRRQLSRAPVLYARLLFVPLLTASAPSPIVDVGWLGQVHLESADVPGSRHGFAAMNAYPQVELALAAFTASTWPTSLPEPHAGHGELPAAGDLHEHRDGHARRH